MNSYSVVIVVKILFFFFALLLGLNTLPHARSPYNSPSMIPANMIECSASSRYFLSQQKHFFFLHALHSGLLPEWLLVD